MKVQEAHLQKEQKNCTMSVLKGRLPGINPNMIIGCNYIYRRVPLPQPSPLAALTSHPITVQFMQQSAEMAKSVEQVERKKFHDVHDDFQLVRSKDSYKY